MQQNFAVQIDVFFNLFQLLTKQKRLVIVVIMYSYFTNLKIALFQVAFLIKIRNRLQQALHDLIT